MKHRTLLRRLSEKEISKNLTNEMVEETYCGFESFNEMIENELTDDMIYFNFLNEKLYVIDCEKLNDEDLLLVYALACFYKNNAPKDIRLEVTVSVVEDILYEKKEHIGISYLLYEYEDMYCVVSSDEIGVIEEYNTLGTENEIMEYYYVTRVNDKNIYFCRNYDTEGGVGDIIGFWGEFRGTYNDNKKYWENYNESE